MSGMARNAGAYDVPHRAINAGHAYKKSNSSYRLLEGCAEHATSQESGQNRSISGRMTTTDRAKHSSRGVTLRTNPYALC